MSDPISNILQPFTKFSARSIVGHVTLSYFFLYTGYNKQEQRLSFQQMYDFVTMYNRGVAWTLVEANKLISLAGLTTMLLSFLPGFKKQSRDLLWSSMLMLWTHSIYSFWKFYNFSPAKVIEDKPIKQVSVGLGTLGQVALCAGYWYLPMDIFAVTATTLGISHFWTMEVDFKYKLQVRPYAYLPFILALPAIANNFNFLKK
jgi:hypothetical protein